MPANWFDDVKLTFEVAWDSDPLSASPVWTDESTRVRRNVPISIRPEGRDSEWDEMQPGSATFAFINDDRRFDTEYASSPLAGKLLPMKRVRISASHGATSEVLFDGFIQGYPQVPTGPKTGDVRITAIDGNWVLANSKLSESEYVRSVLAEEGNGASAYPECYWPLQGSGKAAIGDLDLQNGSYVDIGFPKGSGQRLDDDPVEHVGEAELPIIVGFSCIFDPNSGSLPSIRVYNDNLTWFEFKYSSWSASGSNLGFQFSSESLNRNYHLSDSTTALVDPVDLGTIVDRAGGSRPYALSAWYTSLGIFVAVNGEIVAQRLESEYPGTLHENTLNAGFVGESAGFYDVVPTGVDVGAGISHLKLFTEAPNLTKIRDRWILGLHSYGYPAPDSSGERINRILDEVGFPAGRRSIQDGSSWCGPYVPQGSDARSAIQDVARAEQGYAFLAPDGTLTFLDRDWITNNTRSTTPQLTVTDGGANIEIVGNALESVRNDVEVLFGDLDSFHSGSIRLRDASSKLAYTPVAMSVDAPTIEFGATAEHLASFLLERYSQPRTLVQNLTVKPRKDPAALFPAVFKLRNGDRVRAGRTPQGVGPPVAVDGHVQRVQHRISKDNWETQIYLSPAAPSFSEGPYLTKDDATYGVTGVAAGNKILY